MGQQMNLLHSVPRSELEEVLRTGLRPASAFPELGLEMRRGVVYCWLRREDDRMSSDEQRPDHIYLEVTVDESRCLVADMDLIGAAMTYAGSGGKVQNPEASRLLAEAYRVTAVPLRDYTPGMFFTPEVLVKGDIAPDCIKVVSGES